MNARVEGVLLEDGLERGEISEIDLVEVWSSSAGEGGDAIEREGVRVDEGVDDGDGVAGEEKVHHSVRADVTHAARHQHMTTGARRRHR